MPPPAPAPRRGALTLPAPPPRACARRREPGGAHVARECAAGRGRAPGPRAGAPPGRPARPQGNSAALPPWGLSAPSSTAQGSSPGSAVEEEPAPGHWGPGAAASPGNSGGLALAAPRGPECRSRPFSPRAASGLLGNRDAGLQARKSVPGRAFSPRSAPAVAVLSRARPGRSSGRRAWRTADLRPPTSQPLDWAGFLELGVPSQGSEPQPLIR